MDIRALIDAMMPHFMRNVDALRTGQPAAELDKNQVNAELARLPDKPDDTLR